VASSNIERRCRTSGELQGGNLFAMTWLALVRPARDGVSTDFSSTLLSVGVLVLGFWVSMRSPRWWSVWTSGSSSASFRANSAQPLSIE
jgi:hypothetical protein